MQAIVIGGGISGLTCAFGLKQLGISVVVLEASGRPGGVIRSVEEGGFLFELGPQSFLATEKLLELIGQLGLQNEFLQADPKAPRYILLNGRLHPAPLAPPSLLSTPLLSTRSKWRLLTEPFRRSCPPETDESIADFVRRKFGSELLDHLVAPFVSGVYAGDPERLSLRAAFPSLHEWESKYGSVIRGAMKSRPEKGKPRPALASFRRGVATLPQTLAQQLGDCFWPNTTLDAIRRESTNGKPGYLLEITRSGKPMQLQAPAIVFATPTAATKQILAPISPGFSQALGKIEYAPVAVVAVAYRRQQMQHLLDGFGFLVPRTEGLRVLGTVWNSSLFPGRAPDGMVVLTSFIGGATDPQAVNLKDDEIAAIVQKENAQVLRITGSPVTHAVHRCPRALPQYNLGHSAIIATLREQLTQLPGLFITGNYLEGPAIGACVEHAFRTADSVRHYFEAGS